MKKFLRENINKISILLILVSIIITTTISFWVAQREAFFHPWNDIDSYNYLKINKKFEEIFIESEGKILRGWLNYNIYEDKSPLIIFFIGNAQNSSNFCKYFENKFKYFEGYNTLIIDYPQFGYSTGRLDEKIMLKNTLNIYDYARDLENVDKEKIVVVGYSIGTGFATYLASQREVNGLILISPYDNALNLYNDNLNIFYGLLEKCRRYKLTSDIYAQNVETDPLIIASKMDEIIKYEHSVRLSEKFSKINKMVTLEDVGHQYFFEIPLVLEEMKEYLKERL